MNNLNAPILAGFGPIITTPNIRTAENCRQESRVQIISWRQGIDQARANAKSIKKYGVA